MIKKKKLRKRQEKGVWVVQLAVVGNSFYFTSSSYSLFSITYLSLPTLLPSVVSAKGKKKAEKGQKVEKGNSCFPDADGNAAETCRRYEDVNSGVLLYLTRTREDSEESP